MKSTTTLTHITNTTRIYSYVHMHTMGKSTRVYVRDSIV